MKYKRISLYFSTFAIFLCGCSSLPAYDYFVDRFGLNFQDYFSGSPVLELMPAISKHDSVLFKNLVEEKKIDINFKGKNDVTILHWVIGVQDNLMANVILELGANPDAVCYEGISPLSIAVLSGNLDIIKTLGTHKANFNFELPKLNTGGDYPRHPISFNSGHAPEILKLLLSFGADPNFYKTVEGLKVYQYNFLYASLLDEDYDEALILIQSGADPLISESVKTSLIKFFRKHNSQNPDFIKVKEILRKSGIFEGTEL